MCVISKQFELIEMYNKNICFKHFLNIHNVPDARMFTGNSIDSRGAAEPNHQCISKPLLGTVSALNMLNALLSSLTCTYASHPMIVRRTATRARTASHWHAPR